MIKYVLKHDKFGYYRPSNSGSSWYSDADFVSDPIFATQWSTKETPIEHMFDLLTKRNSIPQLLDRESYSVVPVEIIVNMQEAIPGKDCIDELQNQINELDSMSNDDFDQITEARFKWYKKVKAKLAAIIK